MTTTQRGLFIAFEGGEGSGKSTQAKMLNEGLVNHNIRAMQTREPGGTRVGEKIREILLQRGDGAIMSPVAEVLLFMADRAEHVQRTIKPFLEVGTTVITDRYSASTMAYQSYAGTLNGDHVAMLNSYASGGLKPDITFLLDVDPEVGLKRAMDKNHFEQRGLEYHEKVRSGYLMQRDDSWITISATDNEQMSPTEIHARILDHVLHVMHVVRHLSRGAWSIVPETTPIVETDDLCDAASMIGVNKKLRLVPNSDGSSSIAPSCGACGQVMTQDPRCKDLWHCSASPDSHRQRIWPAKRLEGSFNDCMECGQVLHFLSTNNNLHAPLYYCVNCQRERVLP